MSEFNIFNALVGRRTNFDPSAWNKPGCVSARILNSSVQQRIEDIFAVLKGDSAKTISQISPRDHYGLLDYLGFIIPSLLRRGIMLFTNNCNNAFFRCTAIIYSIPLLILEVALWVIDHVIRNVLAGLFTVVLAIPTILIIHPILAFIEHNIRKNINDLAEINLTCTDNITQPISMDETFNSIDKKGNKIIFWITNEALDINDEIIRVKHEGKYKLNKASGDAAVGSEKQFKEFNSREELFKDPLVNQIMRLA